MTTQTKERLDPRVQREILMEMIYELAESLLPEDNKALPVAAEHQIVAIHHTLSSALQIPVSDD